MPFFSIITPTLLRDTLKRTCESVNEQTFSDWEHVIINDTRETVFGQDEDARRILLTMPEPARDGGNTPRNRAWRQATGRYCFYLDDDNFLADSDALQRIHDTLATSGFPQIAFFPILRLGGRFFPPDPPRACHVDTANLICARELAEWPITTAYGSDGIMIEALVASHPYSMFPNVAPIAVMEKIGFCKP